ncbi:MAG: hypothetical protein ACXVFN_17745 [Solirubrobacteraceae bacterium]
MRRPPGPPPRDGPRALLDHYDNELRPTMRQIRRADRVFAVLYAFTIAVNAMGAVIVDEWWRWACLVIAIGMALALRLHLRKVRAHAREWREFEGSTEQLRRREEGGTGPPNHLYARGL